MSNGADDPSPELLGQQFAEMAETLRGREWGDVTPEQLAELQRLLALTERMLQRTTNEGQGGK